ncbi:hypothetical protein HEP73_03473 [Xanthomonas sp. GW]|uniref:hypothetical protein n=1 Tax=Xanthomonas sp. GW TaxID=2724121 RepID=UPI00163971BA|nr:hypothetical protein [Xanthomonas sp. GW]QNH22525.1 hypothetical protein HEP73_03473 [Xanthomonas sp. GW]
MSIRLPFLAAAGAALLLACATAPAANAGLFHARDLIGDGVFAHGIEGPASGPDVTLQDRGAIEIFRSDRPGREYRR